MDKWSMDMNKQLKKLIWVVITILLLAACGRFETTPASVVISEPIEDIPTIVPSDGLAPESFSPYIGMSYPPFPAGLSQDLSMLIQNSDGYGLWLVNDGANKMLWLSKITRYDANGNSFWEVKDVLALSDLEAGLTLHPDGCLLNGAPDSEIIVAGRNGVIVLAWRANTSLERFEVMATDSIQCNSDKAVNIT